VGLRALFHRHKPSKEGLSQYCSLMTLSSISAGG
jgi:hypothetical protein